MGRDMIPRLLAPLVMVAALLGFAPSAHADDCTTQASTHGEQILTGIVCADESVSAPSSGSGTAPVNLVPVFHPNAGVGACGAALGLNPAACAPAPAPAAPAAAPALT